MYFKLQIKNVPDCLFFLNRKMIPGKLYGQLPMYSLVIGNCGSVDKCCLQHPLLQYSQHWRCAPLHYLLPALVGRRFLFKQELNWQPQPIGPDFGPGQSP